MPDTGVVRHDSSSPYAGHSIVYCLCALRFLLSRDICKAISPETRGVLQKLVSHCLQALSDHFQFVRVLTGQRSENQDGKMYLSGRRIGQKLRYPVYFHFISVIMSVHDLHNVDSSKCLRE